MRAKGSASYEARLIEDGGASASTEAEFFRCAAFLEAENVSHSLVIESETGSLRAPLVVREIPDGGIDATSPYGYPGFGLEGEPSGLPLEPEAIDFSPTGLVSAFMRHALGDPPLGGARPRNLCLLADPTLEAKSRMSDRQQIRKNERRGYLIEVTPGPETEPVLKAAFLKAYTQTMDRTQAADRYYFSAEYFDAILSSPRTWLVVAREPEGAVAAASIAAASDGLLHYYLSGTADDFLRDSPMKNLLAGMIEFAGEMQLPLNLGGGISPGDRLEEFKRGFSNREAQWYTSELICDRPAYLNLSTAASADPHGDFFPAYRA
ncbi:MAG: GNAT family N-acetyltransferase [Solirubrobacterales bacterium]